MVLFPKRKLCAKAHRILSLAVKGSFICVKKKKKKAHRSLPIARSTVVSYGMPYPCLVSYFND
jgi:hypothetical protein